MSTASITVDSLEKIYKASGRKDTPVHALKPLTLEIEPGEVFGLLGPNGAGKTTLVKLLLGIVFPSSGNGSIYGKRIGTTASKRIIGYLPENHRYPQYLTGGGVLEYFGKLSGVPSSELAVRVKDLLHLVNMTKWQKTKVKKYSKGMMQRIGIAQALINNPDVVFLDEPTDGVDPVGRKEIRDIIQHLKIEGKTIFLNSHLLSEVELICDRVAILNKGNLVRMGTIPELTQTGKLFRITSGEEHTGHFATIMNRFSPVKMEGNIATLDVADINELNGCIDILRSEGVLIKSIEPVRVTLEQLFIDIIEGEEAE